MTCRKETQSGKTLNIPSTYLRNDWRDTVLILLYFLRSLEKEGSDVSWHTSEEELDFTPKVWCIYSKCPIEISDLKASFLGD